MYSLYTVTHHCCEKQVLSLTPTRKEQLDCILDSPGPAPGDFPTAGLHLLPLTGTNQHWEITALYADSYVHVYQIIEPDGGLGDPLNWQT